jgi:hypothetical protein
VLDTPAFEITHKAFSTTVACCVSLQAGDKLLGAPAVEIMQLPSIQCR